MRMESWGRCADCSGAVPAGPQERKPQGALQRRAAAGCFVSVQGEFGLSFRGINTTVIQIRRQVFTEVARMAYANVKGEQANHLMRKIPYTIIPGEEGKLRKDIFLERAIVEERVRLAMGLPTRRMDEHNSVVSGLEDASIADKY